MTNTTPQFGTYFNKGFTMTFENGMTISVQFGTGNYCSRKSGDARSLSEMKEYTVSSPNAEISIWDANGTWFNFGNHDAKGFVTPNEVANWIEAINMAESLDHLYAIAAESSIL